MKKKKMKNADGFSGVALQCLRCVHSVCIGIGESGGGVLSKSSTTIII